MPLGLGAFFLVLTLATTWPLALKLTTSFPGDYGDPLFISWVMTWVATRLTAAATDPSVLATFWDAGIFYPEPTALAFSEHFIAQTLLVLPLYWATQNVVLCYNVAFLMSYVLTATGTGLLARALTGSVAAGVLAGVVAAFNEYRLVWEVAHLQTLSIYWFPFVLLGIHRYIAHNARRGLLLAALTWVGLNLSSVYYLAYCAPFIAAFALAELWRSGRLRDLRAWRELIATSLVVAVLTLPFVWPYVVVQQRYQFERTLQEVIAHSATLDAYRAALAKLAIPIALSAIALGGTAAATAFRRRRMASARSAPGPALAWVTALLALAAVWLSLGPVVQFSGRVLDVPAAYPLLAHVPGYSGLRVPARFASVFLILLGVQAGIGLALVSARRARLGAMLSALAVSVFLWQGRHQRIPLDQPLPSQGLAPAPAHLTPATRLPPIYRAVQRLPPNAVVVEFPFGDPWYDVRYMFFAAAHQRRLVNGYSGIFPPAYRAQQAALGRPMRDSARARQALRATTHIVVHKGAWLDDTGAQVSVWLEHEGARLLGEVDGAALYEWPQRP